MKKPSPKSKTRKPRASEVTPSPVIPPQIVIDLAAPALNERTKWFAGSPHIELAATSMTYRELVALATQCSGCTAAGLATEALAAKCRTVITAAHLAKSGKSSDGPNVGAADARLAKARDFLKSVGKPITPARLAGAAKTNFITAEKWLLRNPDPAPQ